MLIPIRAFKGETPILTDNLLESVDAQYAENCDTSRGDLRSIKETSLEENLSASTAIALNEYNNNFITADIDIDYIDSPIAGDQYLRKYFSGNSELRGYSNQQAYPAYYKVGLPIPANAPTLSGYTGSGSITRSYAYCYVTAHGEEGPPSDVTTVNDYASGNVSIGNIPATPPTGRLINRIRMYRGNSALTVSMYQRAFDAYYFDDSTAYAVGDWVVYLGSVYKCTTIHPAGAWDAGHFTVGDDVLDANLGSFCISEDWLEPPANLKGLCCADNGICAGFVGNELFFTHPNLPHAWSVNSLSFMNDIVSLECYGTIFVVMTGKKPVLVYGDSPDTMQPMGGVSDTQPCVSKRSAASSKDGVIFASHEGLILSNSNGNFNITEDYIAVKDWTKLSPSGINGHIYNGKYFGFNASADKSFVFDLTTKDFVRLSDQVHEAFVSPDTGFMYVIVEEREDLADESSDLILKIKKWEGDQYNLKRYTWRSKRFELGQLLNLGAARIQIDTEFYDNMVASAEDDGYFASLNAAMIADMSFGGAFGDDEFGMQEIGGDSLYSLSGSTMAREIAFRMYVDDQETPKFTKTITNAKPFKLPMGYKCRKVEFELSGNVPIFSLDVATSIRELMR